MIKFKDLYVSLESEGPVQGPGSGFFCGLGGGGFGYGPGPNNWAPPVCAQNTVTSITGTVCWTVLQSVIMCAQQPVFQVVGAADAAPTALKEYLRSALDKAVREPKAINDLDELEYLEKKLSGALEEVRARKAEVQEDRYKGESK